MKTGASFVIPFFKVHLERHLLGSIGNVNRLVNISDSQTCLLVIECLSISAVVDAFVSFDRPTTQ